MRSIVVIISICVPFSVSGQFKLKAKDSIAIKSQIEGFYSWYIDLIKGKELNREFNPSFVKSEDGMTTLSFENYRNGLRKHKFSKAFIERKVAEYNPCLDNLRTVPYDRFITYELDEHEQLKCDFSNTYEWSGGMDPIEGAEVSELRIVNKHTVVAIVLLGFYNKPSGGKLSILGNARTIFKRKGNGWEIEDLILE
ncbi:MAG: hypothetical protein ABL895_21590 [Cyclobacteriaceae bacterium]